MGGNCKLIFGLFVILSVLSLLSSTSALTTFGKSPQNPNTPPPPEMSRLTSMGRSGGARPALKTSSSHIGHSSINEKVKECRYDNECSIIQNASCLADPKDKKLKCLCGDFSVPRNGRCVYKYKPVGAACSEDEECGQFAECIDGDNTKVGKHCQCIDGFDEETFKCNAGSSLLSIAFLIFLPLFLNF